jgi:hypothetical protein
MKSGVQLSLLSGGKRLSLSLWGAMLVVLALESTVLAATPVDVYIDFESGNAGDPLTPSMLMSTTHPSSGTWMVSNSMWISTNNSRNLPGPVIVNGVTYNGTGSTHTAMVNDNNQSNFCRYHAASQQNYSKLTIACYLTPGVTNSTTWYRFDTFAIETEVRPGPSLQMSGQNIAQQNGHGQWLDIEGFVYNGSGYTSNFSYQYNPPGEIQVTPAKTYWVNLQLDGPAGLSRAAAFDPDNGFAQVGTTILTTFDVGSYGRANVDFGRADAVGNKPFTSQTYFQHILIDYTNAAFPLIPSSGTDTTPPSAPPTVRDGTGSDIAYTTSSTQLSANWDASTDNESGISGYQYAIGTTAGGTQTVNWTSLGNVTTVTKTGLSLTSGQTYYFSVKAVNTVGLTGSATNSNGQTVDTTAPSAPAIVRDGTGTDISTTTSTTQLSANWDAATDSQSGISGYQYAIGTTAGGTQTANWTSLGNVTTVTKTGLSLTVGQTYYFSVKAVNGAGLTGNATNSNGQTVVAGGGSVTYFQDNFESWTVHGGAWSSVNGESASHTLNTSTTYAKAGAKCLKITDTDSTGTSGAYLAKNFSPAISGDVYVRFFIFLPTGYESANSGCYRRVVRIWSGSNNRGQISVDGGYLYIQYYNGTWTGTLSAAAISENAWHCIEMHIAPPTASTLLEYFVDGASWGTLTADFSASSDFNEVNLGDIAMGTGPNGDGTLYYDELVVSNAYVGTGITSPATYFQDTFDSWTSHGGGWSSVNGESSTHTLNTSTDYAKSGTKSLKLTDTDTTASNGASLTKNFSPTISGDIYVRFYAFFPTGFGSTNSGCRRRVLRVYCGSNRGQVSFQDGAPIVEEVGAYGSVTGAVVSENQWHCIELHMTVPSATTVVEFWVDGVLNSGALMANFSASSTWDHVDLGDITLGGGTNGTGTFYIDEAIVSNAYNGTLP